MIENSKISILPEFKSIVGEDFNGKLDYTHLLSRLTCNPPLPNCLLGSCSICGKTQELREELAEAFENEDVDEITYRSWVTVDRTNLETITKPIDYFVNNLIDYLMKLQRHAFIAQEQSSFLKEMKMQLEQGDFLVIGDFAENYSFVMQDAAQGFIWNNSQAIIHPFVTYYKPADDKSDKIEHLSYVISSDCLKHHTVAVYMFQDKMMKHLKDVIPCMKRVIYFSDGAASQYKNRKSFVNLAFHKEDF